MLDFRTLERYCGESRLTENSFLLWLYINTV